MARVLVVEDEVALNDLVRAHLQQAGHAVRQAHDGPSGLRAAAEFAPELVVLDWMLPGMDGLTVCRELRRRSLVPIIMLTARRDEADRVTGLEVGADDYVLKPFSAERFKSALTHHTAEKLLLARRKRIPEGLQRYHLILSKRVAGIAMKQVECMLQNADRGDLSLIVRPIPDHIDV